MKRYYVIGLFLIILSLSAGYAQDDILTIRKATKIAEGNNPEIKQLQERKNIRQLQKKSSTGIESPEITYFKEGLNEEVSKPFEEQRIAITQSIEFPLKTYYGLRAIDDKIKALEYKIKALKNEVQSRIKTQYVKVLYAKYMQNLRKRQIEINQNMLDAVQTKVDMGEATEMQLTSLEVQLDQAKNKLDLAEKMLHDARYTLFEQMGLPPEDQKYSINFSDTLSTNSQYIHQDSALNLINKTPKIQSAKKKIEASENSIKEARMNYFPDLSFSYYQQDYGSGYNYNGFEFGISIPLWAPLNERGQVQIKLARNKEFYYQKEQIQSNIKKEIEQAWHGYETLHRSIQRYEKSIRDKTRRMLNKNLEAYQLGQIDLVELLNARQIFLDTEANYLSTLRDYYLEIIKLEKYMDQELVY